MYLSAKLNLLDLVRNIASAMCMDPRELRRIVWIRVYSEVEMRVNNVNYNVNNQNNIQNLVEGTF